jgi:hypothetical protein
VKGVLENSGKVNVKEVHKTMERRRSPSSTERQMRGP